MHAWEKSSSQAMAKNGSRQMRFQYSLIVNISSMDQYLTLRNEEWRKWKEWGLLTGFLKKS